MRFGIFMGPTDRTIRVDRLAVAVEELGFDSFWVPEHSHIPVARITPWAGGKELPDGYKRGLSPWIALMAAAAATSTLELGTGCALVSEHDPIHLAKEVATVDLLSGGRVLFGIAAGWNAEELANHGIDPADRWEVMRERTEAMKAIWTRDEPEYHGTHVDFDPIWQWPKPAQRPHPPILVGGNGLRGLRHAVAYGDGWIPFVGRDPVPIRERLVQLDELVAEADRDRLTVTVFGMRDEPEMMDTYAVEGVDHIVFRLNPGPAADVLPKLAHIAKFVAPMADPGSRLAS
jgi:probable F420-dependent oxidoreductase